jgi:hypothetical protein
MSEIGRELVCGRVTVKKSLVLAGLGGLDRQRRFFLVLELGVCQFIEKSGEEN